MLCCWCYELTVSWLYRFAHCGVVGVGCGVAVCGGVLWLLSLALSALCCALCAHSCCSLLLHSVCSLLCCLLLSRGRCLLVVLSFSQHLQQQQQHQQHRMLEEHHKQREHWLLQDHHHHMHHSGSYHLLPPPASPLNMDEARESLDRRDSCLDRLVSVTVASGNGGAAAVAAAVAAEMLGANGNSNKRSRDIAPVDQHQPHQPHQQLDSPRKHSKREATTSIANTGITHRAHTPSIRAHTARHTLVRILYRCIGRYLVQGGGGW